MGRGTGDGETGNGETEAGKNRHRYFLFAVPTVSLGQY